MKMAKATEKDIDAAGDAMGVLQDISSGYYPKRDGDECDDLRFDPEDPAHLRKFYDLMSATLDASPGWPGRVIGGMCYVILYPANEILDPKADTLQMHPQWVKRADGVPGKDPLGQPGVDDGGPYNGLAPAGVAPAQSEKQDMNPTPEQIAESEAEEREAEAFVDAQWKAADAWIAAEWPHASDETRAAVRSVWTELASRCALPVWQPIKSAPRDGNNILLAWGQDGVSQGHYIPGLQGTHPWKFIDTNDGITWIINHAVDGPGGPTHWMPMPKWVRSRIDGVATDGGQQR